MGEGRALMERHYRGLDAHDMDEAVTVFSDDVLTHFAGMRDIHAANIWEAGDAVISEGTYSGTHSATLRSPNGDIPATGRHMDLHYADIMRVRDGQVFYHAVYFDSAEMMAQLGLIPDATAATP
jgi:ketosteroid isomerase-like protein